MANWLDDSTEAELVQGLRDRNSAAAEALERLFLSRLKALARTWGLHEPDAYSVALEALLKVVRRIDSFTERPEAKFRSWVLRIMLNCLKDFVKRRKAQREREVSADALSATETEENGEDETELPMRPRPIIASPISEEPAGGVTPAAVLATAVLDRLSPRERDVMLRTANDMCDGDIAADLGISAIAVRVTRSRARAHAEDALADIAPTLDERIYRKFRKLFS